MLCPMADCEAPLFIEHTLTYSLWVNDKAGWVSDPVNANAQTWRIRCEDGHVVLLPVDHGDDIAEFGAPCTFDNHDHRDMDRLRSLVGLPTQDGPS